MASQDKGRALPKFGEWDVNDPASAEGFTVIFSKARDDKKTTDSGPAEKNDKNRYISNDNYQRPPKRKWLCFG